MARRRRSAAALLARAPKAGQSGRLPTGPSRLGAMAWLGAGLGAMVLTLAAGAALALPRDHPGPLRAALVDQLGLTFGDPGFVHRATAILQQAGYAVDYIPPRAVTVPFYRQFGTEGFRLVILRVHTPRLGLPDGTLGDDVSLLTSEPYSTDEYVPEQLDRQVAPGTLLDEEEHSQPLFTVTDRFVRSSMAGRLDGATVVLMGCSTLRSDVMAKAFVGRGARVVIGWDDDVAGSFTDRATEVLLGHLVAGRLTPSAAVARTMSEIGPDPTYGSRLVAYPA